VGEGEIVRMNTSNDASLGFQYSFLISPYISLSTDYFECIYFLELGKLRNTIRSNDGKIEVETHNIIFEEEEEEKEEEDEDDDDDDRLEVTLGFH
jgi:hypothetical protein